MHLHQLIKTDIPELLLPRLSEKADLMVLGHDHPALGGHWRAGIRRAPSPACPSSAEAVPRGWRQRADDRRHIAVAIDMTHPSTGTLGDVFTDASLRQVPLLVLHAAPLAELASGEQDPRLNLAEILAGSKATTSIST
jgi:hypothetical protein